MKTLHLLCLVTLALLLQGTARASESGEYEFIRFAYDSHTHMLIVQKQADCFIFVLSDVERAAVHTDAGMRQMELKAMTRIADPNLQRTTVPKLSLHGNILHECGKGMTNYHIIKQTTT